MPSDKNRIGKAFRALKKLGYETMAGKMCCGTCSAAEMKTNKYVYYHSQDADAFDEDGNLTDKSRRNAMVYIGHGEDGDGWEIAKALTDQGLIIQWDGSVNTRIAVLRNDRVEYTHPEVAY
jgi:hypothetical protein